MERLNGNNESKNNLNYFVIVIKNSSRKVRKYFNVSLLPKANFKV